MSTAKLTPEEFAHLFEQVQHSAVRLESRRHTDIDSEQPQRQAFLDGRLPEVYDQQPSTWRSMVMRHTSGGRSFRRARVVDEPLTDYNRYMIYTGYQNVRAGEDIRYLRRDEANAIDLPDHDFWVFDSTHLVELRFTDDGRPLEHDLVTDPDIVARHEEWVRRAVEAGTPSVDYVAQDPTRAWPPTRVGATKGS